MSILKEYQRRLTLLSEQSREQLHVFNADLARVAGPLLAQRDAKVQVLRKALETHFSLLKNTEKKETARLLNDVAASFETEKRRAQHEYETRKAALHEEAKTPLTDLEKRLAEKKSEIEARLQADKTALILWFKAAQAAEEAEAAARGANLRASIEAAAAAAAEVVAAEADVVAAEAKVIAAASVL